MIKRYFIFCVLFSSCVRVNKSSDKKVDFKSFIRDSCILSYDTSRSNKLGSGADDGYRILFKNEWNNYVFALINGRFLNLNFYKTEWSSGTTMKSMFVNKSKLNDSLTFVNLNNMHYIAFETARDYSVVNLFYNQGVWRVVFAKGYTMSE